MRTVATKRQFYGRWIANEFGNRLRVWKSMNDITDYDGNIGVRYMVPGSPFMRYNVPQNDVAAVVDEFVCKGADRNQFTFGEMAPDDCIRINAEMVQMYDGIHLHYSTLSNKQMRDALRQRGQYAVGSAALRVLDELLDPCDVDDLKELLERYPEHAIEFSSYRKRVGLLQRRMLIWEVRFF